MHKKIFAALFFAAVAFAATAADYVKKITTSGDPRVGGGTFYGYQSSGLGPGDDAFKKCLALAEESHRPLLIIWGKNSCSSCSQFAKMANTYQKIFSPILGSYNVVNGYFRGNDNGDGPKACLDAKNFFSDERMKKSGGLKGACHGIGFYGVFEDGEIFARSAVLSPSSDELQTRNNFTGIVGGWTKEYDDQYDKHKYTPPKASAGFAVKEGALKATTETEQVYVPFARTNSLDKVEDNWLEVIFPDGEMATNAFTWSKGVEYWEVGVDLVGKLEKAGDKVTLVLLNTNHLAVATNSITCVAKPANSATFPCLPGALDAPVVGEWTTDGSFIATSRDNVAAKRKAVDEVFAVYDEATNALAEAMSAYDSATNLLAAAVAATNATGAAYSEKQTAYNMAAGAYVIATNALAAALAVGNSTYVAYTNSLAEVDASVHAYEAATNALAAALSASNTAYTAYTNAQAVAEAAISTYESSTNAVASAEAQYGVESEQYQSATNMAAIAKSAMDSAVYLCNFSEGEYDTATNKLADADAEVKQAASAIETAEGVRDQAKAAYDDAVDEVEKMQKNVEDLVPALETATTDLNAAKEAYDNAVSDFEGRQADADAKTSALEQAVAGRDSAADALESAEAALAAAEDGFFLVVNGGIVWDDGLRAFNDTVFDSDSFDSWCTSNKVVPVYLDAVDGVGASLYSHVIAANGHSGTEFMSINGLSAAEGVALAVLAEEFSEALFGDSAATSLPLIALVRADGSVCGRLRPQYKANGTCDLNENMARLDELVANSADLAEAANDTLADDLPEIEFDDEDGVSATLSVNDTVDWYKLSGVFTGKEVAIAAEGTGFNGEKPVVVVATGDGTVLDPAVDGIWVFDKSLADDVYISVSAYADDGAASVEYGGKSTFEYTVKATETATGYGKVGFVLTSETVSERPGRTNYLIRVARTDGLTGVVSVKVSLDKTLTTAEPERYEWAGDATLSWKALEAGEKSVGVGLLNDDIWYGTGDIVFDLAVVEGGATNGTAKFVLVYQDDDPSEAGKLSIVDIVPAESGNGKRYVRAGEEVTVRVRRSEGSFGDVAGTLTAKSGSRWTASETKVWPEKSKEVDKEFRFTPPADAFTAAQTEATFAFSSTNAGIVVSTVNNPFKVTVLASDAPQFEQMEVTWSGIQYTTTSTNLTAISVPAGMTVKSLVKIAGSVPGGLKVSMVDNEIVVTGTPTAGTVSSTATYWVSLVRNGGGQVYSMPVTVTFQNKALADVNPGFTKSRSWNGLPVLVDGRLVALIDLSVAKNGKTSARYRMAGGKTVAFSAPGLAGVDKDGTVTLGAKKTVKSGGIAYEYVLSATLGADGSLEASVECDGENVGTTSLPAGAESWSKDNSAERFGGNYVVAFPLADNVHPNTLCFGSPSTRLKFNSTNAWHSGAVVFAGTLPNGKSINGTAYLVPTTNGATSASLPLFVSSSPETFSALLWLDGNGVDASTNAVPFWSHNESGIESLSYENDYFVVGVPWSRAEWQWTGIKMNVNGTSGIAAGTMRLQLGDNPKKLTTVTWRGVALPGDEPQVLGAYWCNKSMPYGDGKKRTVRIGDAVELSDAE